MRELHNLALPYNELQNWLLVVRNRCLMLLPLLPNILEPIQDEDEGHEQEQPKETSDENNRYHPHGVKSKVRTFGARFIRSYLFCASSESELEPLISQAGTLVISSPCNVVGCFSTLMLCPTSPVREAGS